MKFLLLGIGNPGDAYKFTRHNLGTLVLWQLMKLYDSNFNPEKDYVFHYKDHEFMVRWNMSYVNTTGGPMGLLMNKNAIKPGQLLVFFDHLDMAFGQWKYSYGFGTGGHNGLKSIKNVLAGQNYHRIALGIDRPNNDDVSDYVLGKFPQSQLDAIYDLAHELYQKDILNQMINCQSQ
jgi:PTH1 family peptidyl-tRNA hydrolase